MGASRKWWIAVAVVAASVLAAPQAHAQLTAADKQAVAELALRWAVKGGIAYAGTRAVGEAALRYFDRRAPVTRVAGARARFPR